MSKRNRRPRRRMRANEFLLDGPPLKAWRWDENMPDTPVTAPKVRVRVPNPKYDGAAEAKVSASKLAKNLAKQVARNGSPRVFEVASDRHINALEALEERCHRRIRIFTAKKELGK